MHSHSHSYVMIIQTFLAFFLQLFTTESQNPVGQNLGGTKSRPQNPIFLQIPSAHNPIFHIIPAASRGSQLCIPQNACHRPKIHFPQNPGGYFVQRDFFAHWDFVRLNFAAQSPISLKMPSAQNHLCIPQNPKGSKFRQSTIGPKSHFSQNPGETNLFFCPTEFCAYRECVRRGYLDVCRVFVRRDFASDWILCDGKGILSTGFCETRFFATVF